MNLYSSRLGEPITDLPYRVVGFFYAKKIKRDRANDRLPSDPNALKELGRSRAVKELNGGEFLWPLVVMAGL